MKTRILYNGHEYKAQYKKRWYSRWQDVQDVMRRTVFNVRSVAEHHACELEKDYAISRKPWREVPNSQKCGFIQPPEPWERA